MLSLKNTMKAFISGLGVKNLLNSLDFCCFLEKLAEKGQILKTFCDYNAQNLEEFEKNQLPFPVFGKIKVLKANFSNFLLKHRENLKNSKLKISKKINFRFRFFEKLAKKSQILKTFCDYNAQNLEKLRNLEREKAYFRWKINFRFLFFKFWGKNGEILQTFCQNTKVKPWKFKKSAYFQWIPVTSGWKNRFQAFFHFQTQFSPTFCQNNEVKL